MSADYEVDLFVSLQTKSDVSGSNGKKEVKSISQPVAKRHLMVSGSLALRLYYCEVSEGSRAAALRGDKVL